MTSTAKTEIMMDITRDIAIRVLETVDAGLCKGMGDPVPGRMCVEAAVCYAMGLPHSDEPACVSPVLRSLKIRLNDSCWSSDDARAKGLRRLALAQLGSAGSLDEQQFLARVIKMTISRIVPRALRSAASIHQDGKHRVAMEAAAMRCEEMPTAAAARYAATAADAAAVAYARYAAVAYARYADAADAAYADAADADAADADAARYAAYAAADAAAVAYARYADAADAAYVAAAAADAAAVAYARYAAAAVARGVGGDGARDDILVFFAEQVVQILIEMRAPGCQWLDLAPIVSAAP